jgi:hypothetical protein
MTDQWQARVEAAERDGYISRGCCRYLLLLLEHPGRLFHDIDAGFAERLKVDARTLRRWRREAKAAGLIATTIGALSPIERSTHRPPRRPRP